MQFPKRVILASSLCLFSALSQGDPYSITLTDTIEAATTWNGAITGEQYTIKLTFDDGNSTPNSQAWTSSEIQCVTVTVNNAANVTIELDYSAVGAWTADDGSLVTTDGIGTLTTVMTNWEDAPVAGTVLSDNSVEGIGAIWLNASSVIFSAAGGGAGQLNESTQNADVTLANWSNPALDWTACGGTPPAAGATPKSVPTLSVWGLGLLGVVLPMMVAWRRRFR